MNVERTERLSRLIAAYGADSARWPLEAREALGGEDLPGLSEAREIDLILANSGEPVISASGRAEALARIMAATSRPQVRTGWAAAPSRRLWNSWAPVATALAASFALGIYLGSAGLVDNLMPASADSTDTAMLQDVDVTGVSDISELIEGGSS